MYKLALHLQILRTTCNLTNGHSKPVNFSTLSHCGVYDLINPDIPSKSFFKQVNAEWVVGGHTHVQSDVKLETYVKTKIINILLI